MSSELRRRIAFTLGALLIYRIGCFIPLPGLDLSVWTQIFPAHADGILNLFNMSSGGSAGRLAIFTLGILPFVSAAVLIQLVFIVFGRMRTLRAQGEQGRQTVVAFTRYLLFAIAIFQSYGIAVGLEGVPNLIANPGWLFRVSTIVTLTGGALFLVWLSEQITLRGVGNGLALILCTGILTELPSVIVGTLDLGRQGVLSTGVLLMTLAIMIAFVGFVVFMELAQRRLRVEFGARQTGERQVRAQASYLTLKLNGAGAVVPVLGASWLMLAPLLFASYAGGEGSGWLAALARGFASGQPLFMIWYALAIVICVFIYTAMVLDPTQAAESLQRHGGAIQGIEPGEATAAHVDRVLSITTLLGAAYLALVCLIPEILVSYAQVPFYFGGASLLIVVCTVLDIGAFFQVGAFGKLGGYRQ
jgi:preprotein translocase subunit SecY